MLDEMGDAGDGNERLEDAAGAVVVLEELVLFDVGHGRTVLQQGLATQEAGAGLDDEVGGLRGKHLHYRGLDLHIRIL